MNSGEHKKIRLLALDLDDTALRSDLSISGRTKKALKKAEAAGAALVLATGRIPQAMEKFARALGMHRRKGYLICNNGATVHESDTGKTVREIKIEAQAAQAAYELAAAEGFTVQIYENGVIYVSKPNEFTDYDQKLTGAMQVVVRDFKDMVARGCYKLLIPADPVLLAPLQSLLETYLGGEITLFTSKPYYLEILPRNCDKGSALAWVAEKLGVKREEVMAVGDSMNDAAMIRWAGLGAAMVNGDERLKSLADWVSTKTNDEDGVAELIERFVTG